MDALIRTKIEAKKFFAQCPICGRWQEVHPRPGVTDCYFLNLEAEFDCCGETYRAPFALEKDYEFLQG